MNKAMDVRRMKLLGNVVSTSFCLIATAMFFFFHHYGVSSMNGYNIFSVCFYLGSFLLLKYEKFWLYSVLVYMEVTVHMSLAVILVGVGGGFQITLIGMNLLAFYSEYLSAKTQSRQVSGIALGCIGALAYLFSYLYSWYFPPAYDLPQNVCFWLQLICGLVVFVVNIFFLKVFVSITLHSEGLLADAQSQANSMVTALSSDYRSVYYVNLDNNTGICYRADSRDHEQTPEGIEFPYYEHFSEYCRKRVCESYREGFMNFIDPKNIRESLSDRAIIAYRYLAQRGGYEYYEMIRMAGVRRMEERDDHMVHSVGLGMSDIDEEMRETLTRNEALAEALVLAEEANKAKTAFLSSMSHEIRTPMNAIIGLDTLDLNDNTLTSQTREYLEKIDSSAKHLLNLINDILDMSRIESGRMILRREEFSFSSMLEQINTMVMSQCNDKGITYECQILNRVDDYYIGDDMKLKEVLLNILSNAIKFTDAPGSVTMTVERTNMYEEQSTLQFRIKDTGIGMDQDYIPKIFDAFSQEDGSRKNKYGSTGLGMAITRNLVEMMNGTIDVESEKGVGTEFIVSVTLRNTDRKVSDQEESADIGTMQLSGRRVLLAEDIEINAEIMKEILEMNEIEADHAQNGRIVVEMFENSAPGTYSAILMDVRMPEMDGLEAAQAIRALKRDDAKQIPIIALTANAFNEDVQSSLQAGMNAHLSKPVDPDQLLETLGELIYKAENSG